LKLSPATTRTVFRVMSAVLRSAVRDGRIVKNPAEGCPLPRVDRQVLEPLSPSSVLALADSITPRYRVAVLLGACAGLRLGEVLGLQVGRVDFLRRRITVEQQLQPVRAGGVPVLSPLKTPASRRTVPVDDVVVSELAAHLERFGPGPDGLLLANRLGQAVRKSSFGNRWQTAVKDADLPTGTRFHDYADLWVMPMVA